MSTITAGTTVPTALTLTGDTTGALTFQVSGTVTAATLSSSGNLSLATGNLTFSGTAQRITGDFTNATHADRLSFQTNVTNGATTPFFIPNGTGTTAGIVVANNSDPTNSSFGQLRATPTSVDIISSNLGTGTLLPMIFYTGGSERVRIDTSGNLAVGTTNAGTAGLSLSESFNLSWEQSSTESLVNIFRQVSSGASVFASGYKRSATANGFASSYGSSWAKTAISLGTATGAITFYTNTAATAAVGTDVTPSERMRIDSSGNVGIGRSSPNAKLDVAGDIFITKGSSPLFCTGDNQILRIGVNQTEYLRITTDGEVLVAGSTDQGAFNLQCNGTGVWGAGAYVNGSDARIKEDVNPIASGLDVIGKLNPVTYRYKESWTKDQSVQTGFIAQELLTALDGQVYVDGIVQQGGAEGYYSVAYQNIIPILTKAIQEQQAMIDELKAKVAALETK